MNSAMTSVHISGKSSKLDDTVGMIVWSTCHYTIDREPQLRLELYGPSGLRNLVRTNLQITQTLLKGKYAAHELLLDHDKATTCEEHEMHQNEIPGRDIRVNPDGRWNHFEDSQGVQVDAAPIVHRGELHNIIDGLKRNYAHWFLAPCLGYVFTEHPHFRLSTEYFEKLNAIPASLLPRGMNDPRSLLSILAHESQSKPVLLNDGTIVEPPPRDIPGRKLVILGDTSDPSAIIPLAQDASLLVHEATNAWLPPALEKRVTLTTPAEVREKAISRGHSTPDMAGEFANAIRAQRLLLNHFSVK